MRRRPEAGSFFSFTIGRAAPADLRVPAVCLTLALGLAYPSPAWSADAPEAETDKTLSLKDDTAATAAGDSIKKDLDPDAEAGTATAGEIGGELELDFHGYYRTRYVSMFNVPVARLDSNGYLASDLHTGRDDASDAGFFTSRLRLEPSLRWGGDASTGEAPIVALHSQFDVLDTVIWGDNARQAEVPLFAGNPSITGIDGHERPPVFLRRLWMELSVPIGQLRIGRQPSHGGLGILFNDGNYFRNDFGDADGGMTLDRVMFATRPLTIINAITRDDPSETPLIALVGRDRLVEDPLGFGSDPASVDTRQATGPFGWVATPTCGDALDPSGTAPTEKCANDVSQWVTGLIWNDPGLRLRQDTDHLMLGAFYVSRDQAYSNSRLHIVDGFWRFQMGLSETGPSLLTEGEVSVIQGNTNAIKLLPGGLFDEETGLAENTLEGDILNYVARVGLTTPAVDGILEYGHSSGDEQLIGDSQFRMYPMHPDYRVGLLLYPVALYSRSYNTPAGRTSNAMHSGGGVFNSTYVNAKTRYRLPRDTYQIELIAQGIMAWADNLNGGRALGIVSDYFAPRDPEDPFADNSCRPFDPDCALGWEIDLAVRLKWLPGDVPGTGPHDRYMLHWSNEFGVMRAGKALAPRLAEGAATLWTAQSRIAFMW